MTSQLLLDGILPVEARFHPLHVTFTGGSGDAFNRWYPYLEGYSPNFVRTAIDTYAREATSVFDPFGGTGTTAFVAAELGLRSAITEVNPVMQLIFEAKVDARRLNTRARQEVGHEILELSRNLDEELAECAPDSRLQSTYLSTFGRSLFFEDANFEAVLRARTLIDRLAGPHRAARELVTVAALASLIPASRLKRAGDLRYMTKKELAKGIPAFAQEFATRLALVSEDVLRDREPLLRRPVVLGSDVRQMTEVPVDPFDALITSPPYINGTNYFRNARLELWFMRCLRGPGDLRFFRNMALTGGINDVTASKRREPVTESVAAVVRELEANAYDGRIPEMVAAYFAEMTDVFAAIMPHLTRGAPVAVDIGDSNYGGVHVVADRILTDCLSSLGYELRTEVELRGRRSKNGARLRQVLLVYEAPGSRRGPARIETSWRTDWQGFVDRPPHWAPPYSARNWGSGLHSLCSYPGKLKPAIAHHLVRIFTPNAGRMFDPFAGVGTVPFEGASQGRTTFAMDLSPAAYCVTAAKLAVTEAVRTSPLMDELDAFIPDYEPREGENREARSFGLNGQIADYYHPDTLREVLALRHFFRHVAGDDSSSQLVRAACLHLLHGNRPYAFSRRSHPLTPYAPTGETEYRPVMPRIRDKVQRVLEEGVDPHFVPGLAFLGDCTDWWPSEISDLDAVITSPPFFDSTRFHTQNWLRLWFAGWSPGDFNIHPSAFVDERQKAGFDVYRSLLRQARERLKKDGVVVLHLGKSRKCNMAEELSREARTWFARRELFDETVEHCESHGLRDKGTVSTHQYLILY